jgi:hypothetical protein
MKRKKKIIVKKFVNFPISLTWNNFKQSEMNQYVNNYDVPSIIMDNKKIYDPRYLN